MGLILLSFGILMFVHLMKGTEFATTSINIKYLILGRARSARMRVLEPRKEPNFLELAPSKTNSDGNLTHKLSGVTPSEDQRLGSISVADENYLATLDRTAFYLQPYYTVIYDYTTETSVPGLYISVKAGDTVSVITMVDPEGNSTGWWGCKTHTGLYGYLPMNCLQKLSWSMAAWLKETELTAPEEVWGITETPSAPVVVSDNGPRGSTEVTGLRKRNMRSTHAKNPNPSEDADIVKPTSLVDRLSTAKLLLNMAASNGAAITTYHAAMMEAARKGYDSILVFLTNVRPQVRGAGAVYPVPLWAVMKNDHETVLERLLDGAIDTNVFLRREMTSLHTSKENLGSSARPTAEAGADVNVADDKGRTPLMLMAEIGQVAAVELLLGKGAFIDMLDSNEWSAIDYARYGGHLKALGLLEHRRGELPVVKNI